MVTRIVKLTFRKNECEQFLAIFHMYKEQIRAAEGCEYLALLREHGDGNVFFTYSIWRDPKYLEQYRTSPIFAEVWPLTKALFESPAEAWTTQCLAELK